MTTFYLRTFGGAALEQHGVPLDAMGAQRKSLALLALLAVSRRQGISRERLMALLWPESDMVRARGALKQVLHVTRRQLGSSEVIQGTAELRLNPALIATDVDAFLGALERDELDRAVALYGGPFLDGFHLSGSSEFEQWASLQRDDLARRHASALEQLAAAAEAGGRGRAAVEWLHRLHACDPLSAQGALRLMRGLDAVGERGAALRLAQDHETLFREELGSPPHPEVAAMAERLRREAPPPPGPVDVAPVVVTPSKPVEEPATAALATEASVSLPPDVPNAPDAGRRPLLVAAGSLAAAALVGGLLLGGGRSGDRAPEGALPGASVAVLPFVNADEDSASAYLAEEFGNELIVVLARRGGLQVAPGAVTAALDRQGVGMRRIADSLGIAAVVGGSVRSRGGRLNVAARLVAARDGLVLWSAEYDRGIEEILDIQEEITQGVIGALLVPEAQGVVEMVRGDRSTNAAAYELFLQARHHWRRRSRESMQQAVILYEETVERDPAFARAYAGLADAYVNLSNFAIRDPGEALARAEVAADQALQLDPLLGEGYASKGFVLASRGEFRASEEAFQRAIALQPGYTWAHHYYTLLLLMEGRTDQALEHNRQALALDPLSVPANATRGVILGQRGDLVGAERDLERTLALAPGVPLVLYYLGVFRAALGEHESALQLIETVARETPGFTGVPGARIFLYQRMGRPEAADSLLAEAEAHAAHGDTRERVNLALAYGVVGRTDEAFGLLHGVDWDVPSLIEVRADPLLHALRADPRYDRLIRAAR